MVIGGKSLSETLSQLEINVGGTQELVVPQRYSGESGRLVSVQCLTSRMHRDCLLDGEPSDTLISLHQSTPIIFAPCPESNVQTFPCFLVSFHLNLHSLFSTTDGQKSLPPHLRVATISQCAFRSSVPTFFNLFLIRVKKRKETRKFF